ncbi:hypothetical protein TNCV_1086361 [Trichonephila clavipes]|nr:hypothetical protein TNCV_1086361 [Trichonephila clavipes]
MCSSSFRKQTPGLRKKSGEVMLSSGSDEQEKAAPFFQFAIPSFTTLFQILLQTHFGKNIRHCFLSNVHNSMGFLSKKGKREKRDLERWGWWVV